MLTARLEFASLLIRFEMRLDDVLLEAIVEFGELYVDEQTIPKFLLNLEMHSNDAKSTWSSFVLW